MKPFSTILCVIDGSEPSKAALTAAIALAQRLEARLDLLAMSAMATPLFVADGYSGEVFQTALDAARKAAEAALRDAERAASAAGLAYDAALLATPLASVQEAVATRALYADLVVIAQKGAAEESTRRAIDGALFDAPAPLLLWPHTRDPALAGAIGLAPTIAWDARPQASRAARLALPLLDGASEVAIVTVTHDFGDEPFEENPGAPFAAWLARRGLNPVLHHLAGSPVGEVIHQDALERGADLIVMGGYGHSQLREAIFGGATESLLRSSSLPLFMAH